MSITLIDLWEKTIKYGYQTNTERRPGLEAWNRIKNSVPQYSLSWTENSKTIYENLRLMGVTGDDFDEKNESWEAHHFLIQHGRIVKNNDGSLMRLLQIAFNAGQLQAVRERSQLYSEEMLRFYDENRLNRVDMFVDLKSVNVDGASVQDLIALF